MGREIYAMCLNCFLDEHYIDHVLAVWGRLVAVTGLAPEAPAAPVIAVVSTASLLLAILAA